jgi:SAM-dependent methyltransferase
MKVKAPASNIEWKAWARKDPLYAVATCPEMDRNGQNPWTNDAFYALGRSDWEDFHSAWRRYGVDHESCVEIGCGAGRITRQLVGDFGMVQAVDISDDMLAYARQHVKVPNVQFHLCGGADLPVDDASMTAVFSCHVFQHFDDLEVARTYFLEIHRVLAASGTLMVHLPIFWWPATFAGCEKLRRAHKRWIDWKAALNRKMIARGIFRPLMRRLEYPVEWFFSELPRLGFSDISLQIVSPRSSGDPHAFVMARKDDFGAARGQQQPEQKAAEAWI